MVKFNSPTIEKNLEKGGYSFKSKNSDTEVLLKLYDYKGAEMLNELNGMFAFVIYDKNILFGAVDQFQINHCIILYQVIIFAFLQKSNLY